MKTILIVDGYNIIHQQKDDPNTDDFNLEAAREDLIEGLGDYSGYIGYETVVVFDAYTQDGPGERETLRGNIRVVYTPKDVTADSYIERMVYETPKLVPVKVATSDFTLQQVFLALGAERLSARELMEAMTQSRGILPRQMEKNRVMGINQLREHMDETVRNQLESIRRGEDLKKVKKRVKKS
ncbi:NYN domain-containing protein [Eubacterium aggregans]|uniref:NYN domain-containing protein n=1 Tax=Eubacterium aggregans TaxID=81409 RepID=UPI003F34F1C9